MRRLNLPGIIGLIISGIIIGPFGLNILEKNSAVELFSTIGLLYIMFIAGLELDMNEFKKNRHKSVVFGFLTFIIPMAIGFPLCYYLLHYGVNASLLVAGMFATHTLIAYPIVSKLGVSKNQAVAITVGGTIITDMVVLILLAVIMGNNNGNLNEGFWIRLGISVVIFSALMFWAIPRITKWFFNKLESEKYAHYIFVLSVVFLAAFMAEMAGLESIIGAFVAGLALNTLIPNSSPLMNRIEFIGNSLFIPFFLISVGMLVDVKVILSGSTAIIIAAVLLVGAVLGKWLAAIFTQLLFKYSKAQRNLIFGLSSARVAATLAVILVGYREGILDDNILNGTVLLILVTSIISLIATEKASKQILLSEKAPDLSSNLLPVLKNEHILLPIANLLRIEKLLEFTLLIKDKKSVNPITFLSVVPNNNQAELNIISARKSLEKFRNQGAAVEVNVNTVATIDHNAAGGIARISREIMANIIVLGWPKKAGILDKLLGERISAIINNIDKTIFICSIEKQLINQKRLVLLTTKLTEKENGFETWLQKIFILSKELSVPVIHYGTKMTQDAIDSYMKQKHESVSIKFSEFNDWDDFLILSNLLNDDDLIVLVTARRKSISYIHDFERIPSKLEKYFVKNDKIVIYPQQYARLDLLTEDLTMEEVESTLGSNQN
jgi:Kef-type K+ transport system membrane component KefB